MLLRQIFLFFFFVLFVLFSFRYDYIRLFSTELIIQDQFYIRSLVFMSLFCCVHYLILHMFHAHEQIAYKDNRWKSLRENQTTDECDTNKDCLPMSTNKSVHFMCTMRIVDNVTRSLQIKQGETWIYRSQSSSRYEHMFRSFSSNKAFNVRVELMCIDIDRNVWTKIFFVILTDDKLDAIID
jgi:hypothetical protein